MAAQKKSRGLGKGLDALFGDVEVALKKDDEKPPEQEARMMPRLLRRREA